MVCAASGPSCGVATVTNGFNTQRVVKYEADGAEVGEITAVGTPQGFFEAVAFGNGPGVAVDDSSAGTKGDVYVTTKKAVDRFKPKVGHPNEYEYECQIGKVGTGCTAGKNEASKEVHGGVAVDSSGNLFFGAGTKVYDLAASGAEVEELVATGFNTVEGLAIAGDDLYVVTAPVIGEERQLYKVELNGEHNGVEEVEEGIGLEAGEHAVATDPAGNVYVLEEESAGKSHVAVYEPNPTESSTPSETFGTGEIGEAWGIAYSAQGNDRLYITEKTNDAVHVYERGASVVGKPEIEDCQAKPETPVLALLSCVLTPNGEALAGFDYRMGTSGPFTETTPRTVTSAGVFEEEVRHLRPSTEYSFRLAAKNEVGTEATACPTVGAPCPSGEEMSFTTPPAVEGVKPCVATGVGGESATLGGSTLGTIGDVEAKWYFEYALTSSSFGPKTPERVLQELPGIRPSHGHRIGAELRIPLPARGRRCWVRDDRRRVRDVQDAGGPAAARG